MNEGQETGLLDANGQMICLGHTVQYYHRKNAHTPTTTQDGWGREIPLCKHDQVEVPAKEKMITGLVRYDPDMCCFFVQFGNYMLDTGVKRESLGLLIGNGRFDEDRLTIKTKWV